jgi:hypothetical protein
MADLKPFADIFILLVFLLISLVSLSVIGYQEMQKGTLKRVLFPSLNSFKNTTVYLLPLFAFFAFYIYQSPNSLFISDSSLVSRGPAAQNISLLSYNNSKSFQSYKNNITKHLTATSYCIVTTRRNRRFNGPIHNTATSNWKKFFDRHGLSSQTLNQLNGIPSDCLLILPQLKSLSLGQRREISILINQGQKVLITGPIGYLNGLGRVSSNNWTSKYLKLNFVPTTKTANKKHIIDKTNNIALQPAFTSHDSISIKALDSSLALDSEENAQIILEERNKGRFLWTALDPVEQAPFIKDLVFLNALNQLQGRPHIKLSYFPRSQDYSVIENIQRIDRNKKHLDIIKEWSTSKQVSTIRSSSLTILRTKQKDFLGFQSQHTLPIDLMQALLTDTSFDFAMKFEPPFYNIYYHVRKTSGLFQIKNVLPSGLQFRANNDERRQPASQYWKTDMTSLLNWFALRQNLQFDYSIQDDQIQISLTNHNPKTLSEASLLLELPFEKNLSLEDKERPTNDSVKKIKPNNWQLLVQQLAPNETRQIVLKYSL